jgi:hypothetical protein
MADLELPAWMTGLFALAVIGSLLPGPVGHGGRQRRGGAARGLYAGRARDRARRGGALGQPGGWRSRAVYLGSLLTLGAPLLPIAAAGVLEPGPSCARASPAAARAAMTFAMSAFHSGRFRSGRSRWEYRR